MSVDFELRAPREVAVQQSTACGARSSRRGQLAALGQLPGSWNLDVIERALSAKDISKFTSRGRTIDSGIIHCSGILLVRVLGYNSLFVVYCEDLE